MRIMPAFVKRTIQNLEVLVAFEMLNRVKHGANCDKFTNRQSYQE